MRFFNKNESKAAWDWLEEEPQQKKPQQPVRRYRNILLPTDFSAYSERAAQRAQEISMQYSASPHVLHVVEDAIFYDPGYDPIIADMPLRDEMLIQRADESMRRFVERNKLGKDAVLEVQWGNPKWSIVSWAREKGMDLIVGGSHGRRGIERLLGSVSSSVLHQAPCDVLVVK